MAGRPRKQNQDRNAFGRIRTLCPVLRHADARGVVLAQPHRKGRYGRRLESSVGRLCARRGLRAELLDGAELYLELRRRWTSAWGAPRSIGVAEDRPRGSGDGPTLASMARTLEQVQSVERAVANLGLEAVAAFRALVERGEDLPPARDAAAISSLMACAGALSLLEDGASST